MHEEEGKQDAQRHRDDPSGEIGQDETRAFDGRENRDGRGDDRIACKERGPRHGEAEHGQRAVADGEAGQRIERENPAFATVVGPQQEQDIFHRHDQGEGPDQEGEETQHLGLGEAVTRDGAERLAEGIKR